MINAEGMSATLRAVIMMNGANLHASRKGDGFSQIPPALQARVNGRHFWHYCPSVVALGIAELDGLDPQGGNTTIMDAGYREIPHPKMLCTEHKRPLVDTENISLGLRFCILQRPIQSTKRCN